MGSTVVVQGLSCSVACEIFLDQEWNLCLLHWQVDSLPLSHQGSASIFHLKMKSSFSWFYKVLKSSLCGYSIDDIAFPAQMGKSKPRILKWKSLSLWTLCDPIDYTVHGILQARILEWVAFPFSRGSPQLKDWPQVSCIVGGFFTSWVTREAHF